MNRSALTVAVCLTLASSAFAELQLPPIFGDDMILQREQQVPVWGKADPGAKVTVTFDDQSVEGTANDDGSFVVHLEPLQAGGPFELVVESGSDSATFSNVLVGEVWLASGQSNMQWSVQQLNPEDTAALLEAAGDEQLRLFLHPRTTAMEPQFEGGGSWAVDSAQSAAPISAVGYYFAKQLREELGVPVGLIASSWGGTPADAWTPIDVLQTDPITLPIVERDTPDDQEPAGDQPPRLQSKPGRLFNGMIAPISPFGIRGVIWYQGESNAPRAEQYETLFPMMIQSWRDEWREPELPFGFVQLANFRATAEGPTDTDWAHLREAQRLTLEKLEHTGMAVTIDIGEADDIHPRNKADVGDRLARWALHDVYGKTDIVRSGPMFAGVTFEDDKAIVEFTELADGLETRTDGSLQGFTLAGEDGVFHNATATIGDNGETVVVQSDAVAEPAFVRYAWADNPDTANLVNSAGLPASPFRSDDLPGPTDGKR